MKEGPKTFKEICEFIAEADILRNKAGEPPTAEEIFNYSPTGELFMISVWYEQAKIWKRLGK